MPAFRAETAADKDAVYQFRYSVYVEEMGRYKDVADHERRLLIEPEDRHSIVYGASDDTGVVGTLRCTFGGDGFSARQISQYSLEPFLAEMPAELMAIGERLMVAPHLRGASAAGDMRVLMGEDIAARGARIVFGDCEPHLLSLNMSMGCLPYAERNINSNEAGYLIPVVSFFGGVPALLEALGATAARDLPAVLQHVLHGAGGVISSATTAPETYWQQVHDQLARLDAISLHAFADMNDDETRDCIARSNILHCAEGDRLLKKEGSSHNLFVVLDGTLEVRDEARVLGVLTPGDVFGEMAFLLGVPRQRDVVAATDDVRVLALSEGALRKLTNEKPTVSAKLLLNIAKMLCGRLIRADNVSSL